MTLRTCLLFCSITLTAGAEDPFAVTTPGAPGIGGVVPSLGGVGAATPGSVGNALVVTGAAPHAIASLVIGVDVLGVPFAGGVLGPTPDILSAALTIDGSGRLVAPFSIPSSALLGFEVHTQLWINDRVAVGGLSATNTLRVEVQAAVAAVDLFPGQMYDVGPHPRAIASGDLNGDGTDDIVVANESSNDISVLLSDGDGGLADAQHYPAGAGTSTVAIADLDNDGRRDLVVANTQSDNVTVFMGNGSGFFVKTQTIPTGIRPSSLVVTDVDGDRAPDVAVASLGSDAVAIHRGLGDGTLDSAVFLAVPSPVPVFGQALRSVASADFDADGYQDLAVGGYGLHVFWGAGDGTFTRGLRLATYFSALQIAIGDLDADGLPDLAVAGGYTDAVWVYISVPGRRFRELAPLDVGSDVSSVALGDWDRDGLLDLAASSPHSEEVSLFSGEADGSFAERQTVAAGGSRALALADITGDGLLDLATVPFDFTGGRLAVRVGHGDGRFGAPAVRVGEVPRSALCLDLDGDGALDIVTANYYSNDVSVLMGSGDGSFAGRTSSPWGRVRAASRRAIWTVTAWTTWPSRTSTRAICRCCWGAATAASYPRRSWQPGPIPRASRSVTSTATVRSTSWPWTARASP